MGTDDGANRRSALGLTVAVAVLGLCVIAGTLFAGPLRAGRPLWLPTAGNGLPVPHEPGPFQTQTPAPPPGQQQAVQLHLTQWLLWSLLAALVIAGILIYLIRRMMRRSALLTAERVASLTPARATSAASRSDEPAAPVVARGIDRALELLEREREPRDAIVRAWLGLQEAAEASGAGRRPAETPGEYTARIVSRFGADEQAAGILLDLYQGVRFGGHPVDTETVDIARSCLLRLRSSWHDGVTRSGRGSSGTGQGRQAP